MAKKGSNAEYWQGIEKAIGGRVRAVQEYLRHPSSGINAENYFRDLLRQYIPQRYGIESGFVVNADDERSDFMDVLIVDCMHIPPLSAESLFKVFPAEAVVAAVEITTAPKAKVTRSGVEGKIGKLQDDVMKLNKLRAIAKDRKYIAPLTTPLVANQVKVEERTFDYSLSPRAFLITCGDEWANPETYQNHLEAALKAAPGFVNAAFSMAHGMYFFQPYTAKCTRFEQNALLEFIFFINNAIASVPTMRIDLGRYRPTAPDASEEVKPKKL